MPARKGPRRRPTRTDEDRASRNLAPNLRHAVECGRMTEGEAWERVREGEERSRADLIHHAPPEVTIEGPEAVEAWADEWNDRELLTRVYSRGGPRGPRGPIDPRMRLRS
jgi:hypothetical protein